MTKPLSFTQKKWIISNSSSDNESIFEDLLLQRNINPENFHLFLNPSWDQLLDPFLMKDMKKSILRIKQAIDQQQRIMIFGDFDADGITATIILVHALKSLGALVSYRIPNRNKDSHGLKKYLIDEIAEKSVDLIITCDCGTNDFEEIEYAYQLGIDIIITDHHQQDSAKISDKAIGIINPHQESCNYPEQNLSGSGIAFKVIQALSTYYFKENPALQRDFLAEYLPISAIGIITDCVPLQGESRVISALGIPKFLDSKWTGLQELLTISGINSRDISEETVGFCIGPHLNAASRIGNVLEATQLFLGQTSEIQKRLQVLQKYNEKRKELTKYYIDLAQQKVDETQNFQFILMDECLPGILGLIGSRLADDLNSPAILMVKAGENIQASCRAPEGYDIITALKSCDSTLFNMLGGHAGAAGFSIPAKNLSKLKQQLTNYFATIKPSIVEISVDAILNPQAISSEFMQFIKKMAPFGTENPAPIFKFKQVKIKNIVNLGKTGEHLKIIISHQDKDENIEELELLAFFWGKYRENFKIGEYLDVLFTLGQNTWRDVTSIQFKLVDARRAV